MVNNSMTDLERIPGLVTSSEADAVATNGGAGRSALVDAGVAARLALVQVRPTTGSAPKLPTDPITVKGPFVSVKVEPGYATVSA